MYFPWTVCDYPLAQAVEDRIVKAPLIVTKEDDPKLPKQDPDGMLRIVVSAKDPGVANWLDTAGYARGLIQGRWADCDGQPIPTVHKVPLGQVDELMHPATRRVSPAEREQIIRERRAALQQRPLW